MTTGVVEGYNWALNGSEVKRRRDRGKEVGMAKQIGLGEQELHVLRYVTDHAPVTVREVAEMFGEERGLARTTILTMMERLRKKGHLVRRKMPSAYEYLPAVSKDDLLQNLVRDFVQKSLGGSITPFVAYLTDTKSLSERELNDLKTLVDSIEPGHEDGGRS